MGKVSAKHVVRSQTQESHCDKQSEANASCNVDVESHVKRQEHTAKRFTSAITRCPAERTRRYRTNKTTPRHPVVNIHKENAKEHYGTCSKGTKKGFAGFPL